MITDDEVMRLFERADPARVDDVAPVADAAGYLATLHTRSSSNVTLIDTEPARPRPDTRHRRLLVTLAAAAVVAILIGAFVLTGRSDPTEPQIPAATTGAPDTAGAEAAEQIATAFVQARDVWDGATVRSLVADDAVIDDIAVAAADDYLANSESEQATGRRVLQPECTATVVGPPAEVTCTYTMYDAASQALGVGPFTGSSFELVIADGQIHQVTHNFDDTLYWPQVFEVFLEWLDDAHPGDADVLFTRAANGDTIRSLTPEAVALLEQRIAEFEAVGTAIRFVEARDAGDGATVRSLVADDAVIDDYPVAAPDDYLANTEFEQAIGWRFVQPECTATVVGPPAEVTCTYTMENAWSRALDVGPYSGSSFEFVVADGQIQQLTHNFDFSLFDPQVLDAFVEWLDEAHPGDVEVMFDTSESVWVQRITPEAIALAEQYTAEFVASLDDSPAD